MFGHWVPSYTLHISSYIYDGIYRCKSCKLSIQYDFYLYWCETWHCHSPNWGQWQRPPDFPIASMPSKLCNDLDVKSSMVHVHGVPEFILGGLVNSIKIEARNISRSTLGLVFGPHFGHLSQWSEYLARKCTISLWFSLRIHRIRGRS